MDGEPDGLGLAFYYPGWIWRAPEWAKNLVLFFDGIALLVPDYMRDRPELAEPAIVTGLKEQGLLRILEPETFIDEAAAQSLANALIDILASGALDDLPKENEPFRELSMSRLGWGASPHIAEIILNELMERGLARESEDRVSIPMHRHVHTLVLVLLAQILRGTGAKGGIDLWPTTDVPQVHSVLESVLGAPSLASSGHVVSADLEMVGVDVSAVPLDEVLSFRRDYHADHQAYMRGVRRLVRELSAAPSAEHSVILKDRKVEVREAAEKLRKTSAATWGRRAGFALGLTGAVWRATSGDLFGAALAGAAAGSQVPTLGGSGEPAAAFSYLFKAEKRFGSHSF